MAAGAWWRDAVVYEIYVRSFADSDGDGVGDLAGIRSRLGYVADLGVDAIWLTPFYPSPMHDAGYDVTDYCDVDPRFGTLADFDLLLAEAHALGLRVYVDVVPNHTSVEHPWFQAAIADRSSPMRDWYIFRPPAADGSPPNDWKSVFGGSAWTRAPDGDYYLHLFDSSQPDLNWRNPAVHEQFHAILRFWLAREVDGFRIDVAHALYKDRDLHPGDRNAWDQDEVFGVWREWRKVIDDYDGRAFVGEVFLYDMDRVAQYVGRTRLHQAFNFVVARTPFDATVLRATIRRSLELFLRSGTSPTWVLSNHDLVRHPTRYGGGERGVRRGRAVTALLLALPGSPYLYQGEELGLEQSDVPPDRRQDPTWFRQGGIGRDGCRTPMTWTVAAPGHGFTTGDPWLPFDEQARARNVELEEADPGSTLHFYRRALALRRELAPSLRRSVGWPDAHADCVVVTRPTRDGRTLTAVLNTARASRQLQLDAGAGAVVLCSAGRARFDPGTGTLTVPAEAAVWVV
ncbi:MAG: alpha-glucosidase [Frankiaceae bacterium]|nr:alpha-glucosidase [Frankiaceae bacterium]